ncbi:MAG: amidinotransferase [Oligoflexia bacterium]|nr:amidinotransferase [Oligoflexia bacterium]
MSEQSAAAVLMVEPTHFFSNLPTSRDNAFQTHSDPARNADIQRAALTEFNALRRLLEDAGVEVNVFRNASPDTPDSIYPNNWFSTHSGMFVLYPMRAEVRRRERRADIIAWLSQRYPKVMDLTDAEEQGQFLEGTGSLVLDRANKRAYVSLSARSSEDLAKRWAQEMGYSLVLFHSQDAKAQPVYHTNVVMTIGTGYALVGTSLIADTTERDCVTASLQNCGKEIIELSSDQVFDFCANALEVRGRERYLVLSDRSRRVLSGEQVSALSRHVKLLSADLPTIETFGGGGARCMLAELF